MAPLPQAYRWLADLVPLPRMIAEAIRLHGTLESPGTRDNPVILDWAKEVGGSVAEAYRADSIPWCGLFMAVVAKRAGKPLPPDPLWALNWRKFGVEAGQPALGDTLVFMRPGGGHVALYAGEDATAYHVLGGNQADRVCFTRIAKTRLRAVRRPAYRVAPATARPVILAATGAVSTNEA